MSSPGVSSPSPSGRPSSPGPSKLNKLLRVDRRDRSKSSPDAVPALAGTTKAHPSSPPSSPPSAAAESSNNGKPKLVARKASKLLNRKQRSPDASASPRPSASDTLSSPADPELADPPVIIEPPSNARPRSRTKPAAAVDILSSNSSTRGFSEFPSRLSGWLSHTFTGSSTDLSLPNLLSQSNLSASQVLAGSPKTKQPNALLTAARHSKGHLDKAMRYLLDSDAQPDRCGDPIWLMGVQHPGHEPPPSPTTPIPQATFTPTSKRDRRRDSEYTSSPSSFRPPSQNLTIHSNASNQSINSNAGSSVVSIASTKHAISWPPSFYADFTSCIWCTYRSSFPAIRDTSLEQLQPIAPVAGGGASISSISEVVASPSKTKWWTLPEKGWTSDSGWGCMLRTGQSLLANALVNLHLGRDWRKPVHPTFTPEYATYVRILTWFLDSPSPLCPFSVHRMALAGKELGKEVGSWFGPSTAAGAIRRLAHEFPEAGIAVSVAADSVIYQSEVYLASNLGSVQLQNGAPKAHPSSSKKNKWGNKTVLVLIGIRLGIDSVNPIYYETVKVRPTIIFPTLLISFTLLSDAFHFSSISGNSRWSTLLVLLFCRLASRKLVLP
jgi:cysteine protease ATG4